MSDFTNLLRRWKSRATPTTVKSRNKTLVVNLSPQQTDEKDDHHQSGSEGHAFQVNGHPEEAEVKDDLHQSGAEGHAFQVNGHTQPADEKESKS